MGVITSFCRLGVERGFGSAPLSLLLSDYILNNLVTVYAAFFVPERRQHLHKLVCAGNHRERIDLKLHPRLLPMLVLTIDDEGTEIVRSSNQRAPTNIQ